MSHSNHPVLREYDFIIYGANGYTGSLTVNYLKSQPGSSVYKWAIAGRNAERLKTLAGDKIPVIVADLTKSDEVDALVSQTRVILSFAGPYSAYGIPLVEGCVRNSTHYVDVTGEAPFVRQLVDRFHDEAAKKKLNLIPCSGFDSVPSDLSNYAAHKAASKDGKKLSAVQSYIHLHHMGGASGGTLATLLGIAKYVTRADHNPFSLNPPDARKNQPLIKPKFFKYQPRFKKYTYPFIMAPSNTRVVHRSNALLDHKDASYTECQIGTLKHSIIQTIGATLFGLTLVFPPLRFLAKLFVTKQGKGPSEKAKHGARYDFNIEAHATDGTVYEGCIIDERDPYDATAVFAAETTLLLAYRAKLAMVANGGVLTPMAALGDGLVNKLEEKSIKIDVHKVSK